MGTDDLTNEQKIEIFDETFSFFLDQLGPNDIYKQIFLEVLFEEIYGEKVDMSDIYEN